MHHTILKIFFLFFFSAIYGTEINADTISVVFEKPVPATMAFDRSFLMGNSAVFYFWLEENPDIHELHLDDDFVAFNYITASLKSKSWVNLEGMFPQVLPIAHKYQMTAVLQQCAETILANATVNPLYQLEILLRFELATYQQWTNVRPAYASSRSLFLEAFELECPFAAAALCQNLKSEIEYYCSDDYLFSQWKTKPTMVMAFLQQMNTKFQNTGSFCSQIADSPNEEFFHYLLKNGCTLPYGALRRTCEGGNKKLFKTILNMTQKDMSTMAILLEYGYIPLFTKLLTPDMINKTFPDSTSNGYGERYGLLSHAVGLQLPGVVRLLLDMKADPNLGFPAHIAASRKNFPMFVMLVKFGANPFLLSNCGTAFDCSGKSAVVREWIDQYHFEVGFSEDVLKIFDIEE